MSYLPTEHNLASVLTGDTHPGLEVTSVLINGVAPTSNLSSVRADLRVNPDSASATKALTSAGGDITIDDAATWEFTIEPFAMNIAAGNYYYDVETTDAAGVVRTYLTGRCLVVQDVTRT